MFIKILNKFIDTLFDNKLKIKSKSSLSFPTAGLNIYNRILGQQLSIKIK